VVARTIFERARSTRVIEPLTAKSGRPIITCLLLPGSGSRLLR
jgi:hypothetical protein